MAHNRLTSRADVLGKLAYEGGIQAALEYGLTEDDMPEDDPELRQAWHFLRTSFDLAERVAQYVDRLVRTPQGDPCSIYNEHGPR